HRNRQGGKNAQRRNQSNLVDQPAIAFRLWQSRRDLVRKRLVEPQRPAFNIGPDKPDLLIVLAEKAKLACGHPFASAVIKSDPQFQRSGFDLGRVRTRTRPIEERSCLGQSLEGANIEGVEEPFGLSGWFGPRLRQGIDVDRSVCLEM